MRNYKYLLLVSTCLLFNNNSHALGLDLTFNPIHSPFGIQAPDTHTPVELKPISNFVKLAAVCHITDVGCTNIGFGSSDNDMNLDNAAQCKDEGYNLTSCSGKQTPENFCPHNSKYFKSCKCPDEYSYTQADCSSRYQNSIMGDDQCTKPGGTTYATACVCNTVTYSYTSSTCNGNEELSGNICKDMANITHASACTCLGGDTKYKHTDATCKSSHSGFSNWTINNDICQNKATDCVCTPTSGSCADYTLDSNNCNEYQIGESCNNGCQLKWRCKDTCAYKGTLNACPSGYSCTYEDCSKKFYISGCSTGNIDTEKCTWYSCWINTFTK